MKRRSKVRAIAPKSGPKRTSADDTTRLASPAAGEEGEVARLTRELSEAAQQRTAAADVLKVISRSTFDLPTVLNTVVKTAARLCEADKGSIQMRDGRVFRIRAHYSYPRKGLEHAEATPLKADRSSMTGRVATEGKAVQIYDVLADPEYRATGYQKTIGFRTILGVPLLRDGATIGVFVLTRDKVNPFTEQQIALVQSFADQAVIAIENARLLNELRQRTDDLSEALEQQTAASQVLQIISSSPGELLPVFKAMLENATRICEAKFGVLYRYDDNGFEPTVLANAPPAYASFVWSRGQFFPQKGNGLDRLLHTKTVIHSVDEAAEPVPTNSARLGGARSQVMVPMLQGDNLAGAIAIYRQEVRPFSDKQIELVKNFAAQAVIAIENARLLNELRQRTGDLSQRTADLTEALEQQTATSDVLEVISRSAFNLQAVFETVAESSVRLCGADRAFIFRFDGELLRMVVGYNSTPGFVEWVAKNPIRPGRHSGSARGRRARTSTGLSKAAGSKPMSALSSHSLMARNSLRNRWVVAVS
jgi:two-component system, NtrC family, sensor kinase